MNKVASAADARPPIKTPQELVHIKHKITLRQYKYWLLMLRAYREAYELKTLVKEEGFCRIPISLLEEWMGYELVRSELRADLEAIRREPIIYNVLSKDGKSVQRGAGFISEWELTANWIGFRFPPFLQESIERLDLKTAIFQKINWEIFNNFSGKYAAILYKLCRDYAGVGKTRPLSIEEYREYMGLKKGEYEAAKDLMKFVVNLPAKRINNEDKDAEKDKDRIPADIYITPNTIKEGRKIVGVEFLVALKNQTMLDFGDNPAFRFSRIGMPLTKQKEYLDSYKPELIENSILRANDYADQQDKKGASVNYGALYHKAITEEWGVEYESQKALAKEKQGAQEKARAEAKKEQQANQLRELRTTFRTALVNAAVAALSQEQRRDFAQRFISEDETKRAATFNAESVTFGDPFYKTHFSAWLRTRVEVPGDTDAAFTAWLKKEKGIDLSKKPPGPKSA